MAENITTLLEKPDAENVQGSDYLYIVQGSGSKRDRKIKLEALFASDPAHTLVVDEHDLIPKRYLLPSFAKSNEVTRLTPEGGQVYFISKEVTRDGGTARAISGVIANKSITSDLIGDNSVSTDKIIDGSVTPSKLDDSGTYTVEGIRFNNELIGTEVGVAAVRNEKKLLIDGALQCGTLDADSLNVKNGAIIAGDTGVHGDLTVLTSKKLTAAGEVEFGDTKARKLTLSVGNGALYSVIKADSTFNLGIYSGNEGEIKVVFNMNNQYPIDVTCTTGTITIPVHCAHMFIGMGSSSWVSID